LLEPDAKRPPPKGGRPHAGGRARSIIDKSPNGRLHIALVAALFAISLIAVAIPISRTQARVEPRNGPGASGAGAGLVSALQSQADGVTRVLASPGMEQGGAYAVDLPSVPGSALIPRPLLVAAARLAVRGAIGSAGGQSSLIVQREHPVSFTLHENGFASSHTSAEVTVGQALAGLGIRLRSYDAVSPGADNELTPGEHVYVRYASSVRLLTGGEEQTLYTQADTVGQMLAEAGMQLEPMDRVWPGTDATVREGMTVRLVTIRDLRDVEEEPIGFDTVYVYDAKLPKGERRLVQAGSDGAIQHEYKSRTVEGRRVSRDLVGDTVVPPTDEIIAIGTYVPPTPAPTARPAPPPDPGDCPRTLTVYATWYTASSAGGSGRTATGTSVYKGIVAVDPAIIPLGTRMYIPGYGYGLAADTGGGIKGYTIDLGYGANDVFDWRTRWADICLY
jgi:3D (Asp-Asp-Asp) domain-containing protein